MLYTALTSVATLVKEMLPFDERVDYALKVSTIGIIAVFLALTLIMLILKLMRVVMDGIDKVKVKRNVRKMKSLSDIDSLPTTQEPSSDDELVAVITAAIAATLSETDSKSGTTSGTSKSAFRVVSFRRVGSDNKTEQN